MKKFLVVFLKFYQSYLSSFFKTFFGGGCRFTPTCSQYTIEAVEKFGSIKGLWLGAKRITKCNPWGGFGYDPVSR